jgi:hypothetical protein
MRSFLDDFALMQDKDSVAVFDCAQAVRDEDGRNIPGILIDRAVKSPFRNRIEVTGCLVENQDVRLLKHCPRDGKALSLASREVLAVLCEAAAVYKLQGRTLCDAVNDIFVKYGYYLENLSFLVLKGADGAEKIRTMMETMRSKDIDSIAGLKVEAVRDYQFDTRKDLKTGEVTATGLPKSNVLYYELERGAWLAVRPSGTEPKIKFYMGVKGTSLSDAEEKLNALTDALKSMI